MEELVIYIFLVLIIIVLIINVLVSILISNYKKISLKQSAVMILKDEEINIQHYLRLIEKNIFDLKEMELDSKTYMFYLKELKRELRINENKIKRIHKGIKEINTKYNDYKILNILRRNTYSIDKKENKINCYDSIIDSTNEYIKYQNIIKIQKKVILKRKIKLYSLYILVFIKGVKIK